MLARRQLAVLVVRLLRELEDIVGDGHGFLVVEDGEKVIRVDASTGCVRHEECALARRSERVNVEITLALVVRPRR